MILKLKLWWIRRRIRALEQWELHLLASLHTVQREQLPKARAAHDDLLYPVTEANYGTR